VLISIQPLWSFNPCGLEAVTTEAYVKCVGATLYQNLTASPPLKPDKTDESGIECANP